MKALAYNIDGKTCCCVCADRIAKQSNYCHLFFVTNKPYLVDADKLCQECGHFCGREDAGDAANRIADIIDSETMPR